jgi:TIR domain
MPEKKKIFFCYSDNENDQRQFTNLCLHFSVLQDKAELWYKAKLIGGDNTDEVIQQKVSESDIFLPLLSVHYLNDANCQKQFETSISDKKILIPVLLSSFDWQSDEHLKNLGQEILPEDKRAIDLHENFNEVCTEIVQNVKKVVFGEKIAKKNDNSRTFYWILAAIILIIGGLSAVFVYKLFQDFIIPVIVFLMFVSIDLLILRNLLFPTNISSLKL